MENFLNLAPALLFLAALLYISYWVQQQSSEARSSNFVKDYFIGGRSLGGFVLAMTTVATYSSVSTFVGGPGVAWQIGYGWLYMAIVQMVVIFLVMGVFGKKISLIAKDIDAVTVIDIIRARYKSDALANMAAIFIVAFFCATMVAQFVGAAKLFEAVTGYSYMTGLTMFGIIVVIYTTIGGFKGVAITDAICAIAMMIGMGILFYCLLDKAGGYSAIMAHFRANDPAMLEPLSRGKMPISLYISQWLLVGVCTLALPQSVVRSISYKDTKALRQAIIIGTIVIGVVTIIATWVGVLCKGVLTNPSLAAYGGSVDNIMPRTIISVMSPFWAGVVIIGPIAATISTVSSLLLTSSSSIIKDVYMRHLEKSGKTLSNDGVKRLSMIFTILLGFGIYLISIAPPSVIWKINMFAFGGLETAFFWVMIFGLFWHKANSTGAICAMFGGVVAYCVTMALGFKVFSLHQITIGITTSLIFFFIGNAMGKMPDMETLKLFFPDKYEDD
ncbi:MAG: sodium/pantothenate symporter [Acidaminococcaceae bacterium]|nr:sodium/pantothenate symporter [Acidaminococcaceae bacterium]MBO6183005.1 sodium/pantothenate symporter [Acidaminococcaceae bacterium]MBO6264824.1 sodium/pantothenate symporter [Acidaminococcaceae bacterium]MBP3263991.1 sodium/pantothenate symporter [Acidaminococcaceae bacterium]MBQ5343808.1 sodium/pantothenate symporter [Acidaminococcaceae bacterium]